MALLHDARVRLDDRRQRIDVLERENRELHVCLRAAYAEAERLKGELAASSQDTLRKALAFYADSFNWEAGDPSEINIDKGACARAALAAAGPSEQKEQEQADG